MTNPQKPTLLGMTEMAELYGVSRQTATGWRRQTNFPKPIAELAMGPVWDLEDLKAWRTPPFARPGDHRLVVLACAWCSSENLDVYSLRVTDPQTALIVSEYDCDHCGETTILRTTVHRQGIAAMTMRKESK